eukprot:TRINITY_DN3789_c0_g1_i1.p1 TRINITY_DN3789_c0_g1~~TRINITY_DN3789_c0_g1_i1.p1  ORF type:complete len:314 (-),score=36.82 TRINITY_DN3789_c0_g1_i1:636-1577(-)
MYFHVFIWCLVSASQTPSLTQHGLECERMFDGEIISSDVLQPGLYICPPGTNETVVVGGPQYWSGVTIGQPSNLMVTVDICGPDLNDESDEALLALDDCTLRNGIPLSFDEIINTTEPTNFPGHNYTCQRYSTPNAQFPAGWYALCYYYYGTWYQPMGTTIIRDPPESRGTGSGEFWWWWILMICVFVFWLIVFLALLPFRVKSKVSDGNQLKEKEPAKPEVPEQVQCPEHEHDVDKISEHEIASREEQTKEEQNKRQRQTIQELEKLLRHEIEQRNDVERLAIQDHLMMSRHIAGVWHMLRRHSVCCVCINF